jgi:hypothetical protein
MKLRSRKTLPPGGFTYTDPNKGLTFDGSVSFLEQVGIVSRYRKANNFPRPSPVEVSEDLEAFTCARLPDFCSPSESAEDKKKGPGFLPQSLQRLVSRAAGAGSRVAVGARILNEWRMEGPDPVAPDKAEARASVCAMCPYNQPEASFSIVGAAAETFKALMEVRARKKIQTSNDEKLGVCDVCGCHLKLKVHTPLELVESGTPEDMLQMFPKICWVRTEIENKP